MTRYSPTGMGIWDSDSDDSEDLFDSESKTQLEYKEATNLDEQQPKKQRFILPDWFLSHNVKTSAELTNLQIPEEDALHPSILLSSSYSQLHDITTSTFIPDDLGTITPSETSVLLYSASPTDKRFFDNIILHLAVDLKADLISLDIEDLADLGWEFDRQEFEDFEVDVDEPNILGARLRCAATKEPEHVVNRKSLYGFAEHYFGCKTPNRSSDAALAAIFDAPGEKHLILDDNHISVDPSKAGSQNESPILLHIHLRTNVSEGRFLAKLREAVRTMRKSGQLIVLIATMYLNRKDRPSVVDDLDPLAHFRSPWASYRAGESAVPSIRKVFAEIGVSEASTVEITSPTPPGKLSHQRKLRGKANYRRLKRMLRSRIPQFSSGLLEPHSDWPTSIFGKIRQIGQKVWSEEEIQRAVTQIVGRIWGKSSLEFEDIRVVLIRLGLFCTGSLFGIPKEKDSEKPGEGVKNAAVKEVLTWKQKMENISKSCNEHEKEFIQSIVNPDNLNSTFDDVIVDEEIKDTVKHLISFSDTSKEIGSSYLLNEIRINGALLYGPPGTGKTHLCRAIAKDSGRTMLCVNAATIQNKYVGETEKYIRAAFSLAAKLSPCVMFMDEVDALFYRRQEGDKSWQRNAITQFLQEMDGLGNSDKAPFVVVATNRPKDLDDAFLRRLPQKIALGLPTEAARSQILEGFLKDERLDAGFGVSKLASQTEGYSGSDLRSLCAETAMIAVIELKNGIKEGIVEKEELGSKLLLKVSHFEKALGKIRPTVSEDAMKALEGFAKRFSS